MITASPFTIAIAALAIAMGCPEERVDEVQRILGVQRLPLTPGEAVFQVDAALRQMEIR
jgi:hypothetical protein